MKFILENQKICTIKMAAERSGLSTHVIRIWERRYQAVKPARTSSNRRLFSESDILRLQLLKRAVDAGHYISRVANLPSDDLMRIINTEFHPTDLPKSEPRAAYSANHFLNLALQNVKMLNANVLKKTLEKASVHLTKLQLVNAVIVPLYNKIGILWRQGELKIIHEHLATPVISSILWSLLDVPKNADEVPRIVIATPLNQRHDLGALAIAVITREAGWHGTYFGSNLPADEIAAAALRTNARAVALSITFAVNQRQLVTEMKKLRCHLSRGTDIFVGGQGAAQIMDQLSGCNIVLLTDLQKLSIELDRLLSRRDNQIFAK